MSISSDGVTIDENRMRERRKKSPATTPGGVRVLSTSTVGSVSICPAGCVHIDTKGVSLRLTERTYRDLVDLLSRARAELPVTTRATVH